MTKDSGKKLFDVVLVWKFDRFARNRFDSANYKMILKKNGIHLLFRKTCLTGCRSVWCCANL